MPKRFAYPLEAVQRMRIWRRDAAGSVVARLQKGLAVARARVMATEAEAASQAALAQQAWENRHDPCARQALVVWLVAHKAREAALRRQAQALGVQLHAAREEFARRQQDLDGIEEHRHAARLAFRRGIQKAEQAAADHDWVTRPKDGKPA